MGGLFQKSRTHLESSSDSEKVLRDWRPDAYESETCGCRVRFELPVVELWDYNERWEELETSSNPLAVPTERQLRRRFTDLPRWVSKQLERATREDLERWSDRVLDAGRLEDVFDSA